MTNVRRIEKELRTMQSDPESECIVDKVGDNVFHWHAKFQGPDESPFAGGTFLLDINFPADYPFAPPKVRFLTKVYHCNISASGGICLDILKDAWSPGLSISKVSDAIFSLYIVPNYCANEY